VYVVGRDECSAKGKYLKVIAKIFRSSRRKCILGKAEIIINSDILLNIL
jgi:hypothetical protein